MIFLLISNYLCNSDEEISEVGLHQSIDLLFCLCSDVIVLDLESSGNDVLDLIHLC